MTARKENSTYSLNEKFITECDLTYAANKIGGRWKIVILDKLGNRKLRFGELKKEFPYITERMLTLQLRALEQDELVKRTVYAEIPPRVEYELTPMALEFLPIFCQLSAWGKKNKALKKQADLKGNLP
ncbi:winged helix-turn-helix transcriptional regulator [Pedobacter miscanthi]|uniref:Transcriptional regulator n=1 Tax=Pedobacter miscanthi TaxID=2259170 RepID=A0A366LD57_9SPHI|nr:helix-turn-helix domain-containing protein [Pedobacter miscanthi]RBQ11423.1 transcriptional regulator [Pedobacter miscanthi]